jgi:hypothetical protein
MQVEILINDKIYKTVTVTGESYQPRDYWPQINSDKENGLLTSFDIENGMKVQFRPVVE